MILVVDDNENNIFSLTRLLESKGVHVNTVNTEEEVLVEALKNDYSSIILDVQITGMPGFEVAETLSGYSKTKKIPTIFLSAFNIDKTFITKEYKSGGIYYVTKPIDPNILTLKVKIFYDLQERKLALKRFQRRLELEGSKETQASIISEIDDFHLMLEERSQIAFTLDEYGTVNFVNKFLSIASHELKMPITSIKAYMQLVYRKLKQNPENTQTAFITKASYRIEKLNNLITNPLDASKIENAKLRINKEPLDVDKLIDSAIETILQTHNNTKSKIWRRFEKMTLHIPFDAVRIEKLLINFNQS